MPLGQHPADISAVRQDRDTLDNHMRTQMRPSISGETGETVTATNSRAFTQSMQPQWWLQQDVEGHTGTTMSKSTFAGDLHGYDNAAVTSDCAVIDDWRRTLEGLYAEFGRGSN